MSAKVIDLNAFKAKREERKFDAIIEERQELENDINSLATNLTIDIADALEEYGYNVRNNARAHDLMMIIEAITSLAYRSVEESYPLHDISEQMFAFEDEDEFKFSLLDEE